ncbi:MAG: hypothetical protein QG597_2814 [Actinomycetota bacterium]|nr:hypothetical protein [Actinomycetota bacterium]
MACSVAVSWAIGGDEQFAGAARFHGAAGQLHPVVGLLFQRVESREVV